MNWGLRRRPGFSPVNESAETLLERAIIRTSDAGWYNEVPTASGLWSSASDRRSNVDLCRRIQTGVFELIELKVASNTPAVATIQSLGYGLLYLQARKRYPYSLLNQHELLAAREIRLGVLAPLPYFHGFDGQRLQRFLSDALQRLADKVCPGLSISFAYWSFPVDFEWPCPDEALGDFVKGIRPLY